MLTILEVILPSVSASTFGYFPCCVKARAGGQTFTSESREPIMEQVSSYRLYGVCVTRFNNHRVLASSPSWRTEDTVGSPGDLDSLGLFSGYGSLVFVD